MKIHLNFCKFTHHAMSQIKRFIQAEQLAKPQSLIREWFAKGKMPASAKDQFIEAREAAQTEGDGNV